VENATGLGLIFRYLRHGLPTAIRARISIMFVE
jgi:hypothetical protein